MQTYSPNDLVSVHS